MLRLVEQCWPLESNVGPLTAAEFLDRYGLIRYCASVDEFRQMAPVAAAQGLALINAGYVYDAEVMERLPRLHSELVLEHMGAGDLTTHLERLEPATEQALLPFLTSAQRAVRKLGCEALVRAFDPVSLPALYLLDHDAAFQADVAHVRQSADGTWAAILEGFQDPEPALPRLVFNHRNALVRQIIGLGDPELTGLCVEGLYVQALLLGHHPLRPADTAVLNQSFLGLIARAAANGSAQ